MKTNYHSTLNPQGVYHLYNKAVSDRKLFYDDSDYRRFLTKFKKYFTPYLDIIAYCLIPNHFHFQVQVKNIDNTLLTHIKKERTQAAIKFLSEDYSLDEFLSDQFRRLFSGHSLFINKKYDIKGPLLLKKIKKTEVKTEAKFYDLICYIHHNPIHHRLSKTYEDWPYTSFLEYIHEYLMITPHLIFEELGNGDIKKGKAEFLILHQEYKEEFIEGSNEGSNEGFASL